MRRIALKPFVTALCCLATIAVNAQAPASTAQAPALTTQAPATGQTTPPQKAAAAPATPAAEPEVQRSLFEPTAREFLIGGRFSNVDGDEARFQRYQDIRDGLLFSGVGYAVEQPQGDWSFRALADNVGWRDQRYFADYDRTGRFVVSGTWDQIPQFYSIDTRTPYTTSGGNLVLDDATQRAIQNGQATSQAYVALAPQFDLIERRDIGQVNLKATPTPHVDVTAGYTLQRHSGELPWGASFGFNNDVEVPLPYDSRTNDFTLGTEWSKGGNMVRVGYQGTWFDNLDDTLVWDSPLRLDDSSSAPGRGRMSLWPSNSANTFSAAASTALPRHTRITGFFSYGVWNNDEPVLPFTINSALPVLPLPRTTTEGKAGITSVNLNFVSHPAAEWRFSARLRDYDYNNKTPAFPITQFVNYDTSLATSATGGPERFAHNRLTFDSDATWSGIPQMAFTVGYSRNNTGYDYRIFESSGENVFRIAADAVGTSWLTFRTQYEYGDRSGSGLDEELLTEIGEHPEIRHYDVADRTRNRFTAQADIVPDDIWTFSVSGGVGKDDFNNTELGLLDSTFRTISFGVDYHLPSGFGAGGTYNYERYAGLQRSHEGDNSAAQFNDPLRDWTADSRETVHYFSLFVTPPRIGRNTEARFSYDYSNATGSYLYAIPAGSPIVAPNQLPDVYNKLQQLKLDVRHRLSNRMSANVTYLYEPFRVYDFAFDPSVVNGIVQPSSLVMGYVYRPYTAHAFMAGLRVYW